MYTPTNTAGSITSPADLVGKSVRWSADGGYKSGHVEYVSPSNTAEVVVHTTGGTYRAHWLALEVRADG